MKKNISSLIISSFLLTICIGTIMLMLPFSTNHGITPEDAFFTSTSAVTVTGLIVMDTATDFTMFGQFIILVLLQIGGLGFMTFSTFGILIMGKAFSIQDTCFIENDFTPGTYKNIKQLAIQIIVVTFSLELVGAVLLYFQFTRLDGFHRVFASLFHSISAFCNAGFSLFSNSFEDYKGDWGINFTLMALIILGGIGFLVIYEFGLFVRRKIKRVSKFSLHSKIVLISSLILIFTGALVIFIEELLNTQNHLPIGENILTALFQSVSTRTAGFNTLTYSFMAPASIFVMILLMFIGASPGSTGGGIKTTSASVVIGYIRSRLQGKDRVTLFFRNIPIKAIEKTFLVIIVSFTLISIFFILMLTFEPQMRMGDLLFETVSAFGTVGLSMGITGDLSLPSRLLVSVCMFIGRIGPLTLLIALSKRESRAMIKYPEDHIMIG